jgi:hypothetical protein
VRDLSQQVLSMMLLVSQLLQLVGEGKMMALSRGDEFVSLQLVGEGKIRCLAAKWMDALESRG